VARRQNIGGQEESSSTPPAYRRTAKRAALLALVLGVMIWINYFSPLKDEMRHLSRLIVRLRGGGTEAYAAFTAVVALLVAAGVPRLVLCGAGGLLFGFWWGLLLSEIGTVAGSYALFLFVRWGGRDWVLHRWPNLRRWSHNLRSAGLPTVLIMRQLPVAGFAVNLVLGLTHIRNRDFLLGTALGLLPEGVPATMIGAGLMHGKPQLAVGIIAAAVILLAGAWIIMGLYLRRSQRQTGVAATGPEGNSSLHRTPSNLT